MAKPQKQQREKTPSELGKKDPTVEKFNELILKWLKEMKQQSMLQWIRNPILLKNRLSTLALPIEKVHFVYQKGGVFSDLQNSLLNDGTAIVLADITYDENCLVICEAEKLESPKGKPFLKKCETFLKEGGYLLVIIIEPMQRRFKNELSKLGVSDDAIAHRLFFWNGFPDGAFEDVVRSILRRKQNDAAELTK